MIRLKSLLLINVAFGLFFAWAEVWGWPGAPLLGATQFPISWCLWIVMGFVIGHGMIFKAVEHTSSGGAFLFEVAGISCILASLWIRERAKSVIDYRGIRGFPFPDHLIIALNDALIGSPATPRFWKVNCTHPPAIIVAGFLISFFTFSFGLCLGLRSRHSLREELIDRRRRSSI